MTITDDLKWNVHVANILLKAFKRLYFWQVYSRTDLIQAQCHSFTQAFLIIYQNSLLADAVYLWHDEINSVCEQATIKRDRTNSEKNLKNYLAIAYVDYGEALEMGNLYRKTKGPRRELRARSFVKNCSVKLKKMKITNFTDFYQRWIRLFIPSEHLGNIISQRLGLIDLRILLSLSTHHERK